MSEVTSSRSVSSKIHPVTSRIPRLCKCVPPQPLKQRTSWTINNPCRRFMTCPDSLIPWKRCKEWYWVDDELPNEWYKANVYELYQTLDRDQRQSYYDMMSYRERLSKMEDDFALYRSEMEESIGLLQLEVMKNKKKFIMFMKLSLSLAIVLVYVMLF